MIHRDVKPENILLDAGHKLAMLADFSLALTLLDPKKLAKAEAWGTAAYAAPEIWQEKAGKASDIYALGVVLYEMLTGRLPFTGDRAALRKAHISGKVPSVQGLVPELSGTSIVAMDKLFRQILSKKVADRPSKVTFIHKQFQQILANNVPPKLSSKSIAVRPEPIVQAKPSRLSRLPGYFLVGIFVSIFLGMPGYIIISNILLTSPKLTFKAYTSEIIGISWSPDSTQIASIARDERMKIWDAKTGKSANSFSGENAVVHSVAWSPNGEYIAVGAANGTIQLWAADRNRQDADVFIPGHNDIIKSLSWSPDSRRLATAGQNGTVKVWDFSPRPTRFNPPVYTSTHHIGPINAIAWSPDGNYLLSGNDDGTVLLSSSQNGKLIREIYNHKKPVYSVAWSSDSRIIASGGADSFVRFSNIYGGQLDGSHPGYPVLSLAWRPNSDTIVFGLQSKERGLIQSRGGYLDKAMRQNAAVSAVAWSSDGKTVAVATGLEIRLYEPETKPRLRFSQ
jgi:serine/threonine protein kinase